MLKIGGGIKLVILKKNASSETNAGFTVLPFTQAPPSLWNYLWSWEIAVSPFTPPPRVGTFHTESNEVEYYRDCMLSHSNTASWNQTITWRQRPIVQSFPSLCQMLNATPIFSTIPFNTGAILPWMYCLAFTRQTSTGKTGFWWTVPEATNQMVLFSLRMHTYQYTSVNAPILCHRYQFASLTPSRQVE